MSGFHLMYLGIIALVILAMCFRKNVTLICIIGTFIMGFVYHDLSVLQGIQTIFWAFLTASSKLLDLILLIAMMTAMISAIRSLGIDELIVRPFQYMMISPGTSYLVLIISMYLASIFFWPTPATALIGAILVPAAIKTGLSLMGAAVAINISGHGIALSSDPIIQGAPGFSERAIGLAPGSIVSEAVLYSTIAGILASLVAFIMYRQDFITGKFKSNTKLNTEHSTQNLTWKRVLISAFVLIALLSVLYIMITQNIKGQEATALLGGFALIVTIAITIMTGSSTFWDQIADYLNQGFIFAMKIFGKVIPITGFFFIGSDQSQQIIDENAPILLYDIAEYFSEIIPLTSITLYFGNMFLGIISGLDGSGFSGIALTANFAQSMERIVDVDLESLAAIGQMGAIWTGGGTLISWAFGLVTTAGVVGVDPVELARKNFIPVMIGLIFSTLFACIIN